MWLDFFFFFNELHVFLLVFQKCLHIDPDKRPFCAELLHHDFFCMDGFAERYSTGSCFPGLPGLELK